MADDTSNSDPDLDGAAVQSPKERSRVLARVDWHGWLVEKVIDDDGDEVFNISFPSALEDESLGVRETSPDFQMKGLLPNELEDLRMVLDGIVRMERVRR